MSADIDAAELAERDTRFDTAFTTEELGAAARPFDETVHDTLRWLVETGHLEPKYVGTLCTAACRLTSRSMTAKASPVAYVGSVTTLDATTAPGIRPDSTVERAIAATKPHLRGWLHAGVTPLVLAAGIVLICLSPTPMARLAASIYALSGFLLFATSALFHRGNWSPVADRRFNRIDHANIYLIIAGSYTPVALLGLPSPTREMLLTFVWVGALVGITFRMLWMGAPRMLYTALYIALGWSVAPVIGQLFATRIAAAVLTVVGGGLYTLGGVVFGFKWPDPSPLWFGYHEVFHLATIAAWTCQYIAISMLTYR